MITLAEAKTHLRIDGTDSDTEITTMIAAAGAHVQNYLGITYASGAAPAPVKAACALLVADLYENRELQSDTAYYTNRTFAQLLNPYRSMEV